MKLHSPFQISSRLMPAIKIGGAWISLDCGKTTDEGRTRYNVWIDLPDGTEHQVTDLKSGVGGGDVQSGFVALLSFLGAAAESYSFRMRTGYRGENEDLFPAPVVRWAYENSDDITAAQIELEENTELIEN